MSGASDSDYARERMLRARKEIDEYMGELEARAGVEPGPEAPPRRRMAAATERSPELRERLEELDEVLELRIADAAEGIEQRVGEWVNDRVKSAERRLELQSEALEAALGEEAAEASKAVQAIDASRARLDQARDAALAAISATVDEARTQASAGVAEDLRESLQDACRKIDDLGTAVEGEAGKKLVDRARSETAAAIADAESRIAAAGGDAARRLVELLDKRLSGAVGSLTEHGEELERSRREQLSTALNAAVERVAGEGEAVRDAAIGAAREAAAERAGEYLSEGENRLGKQLDEGIETRRRELADEARKRSAELAAELRSQLEERIAGSLDRADESLKGEQREAIEWATQRLSREQREQIAATETKLAVRASELTTEMQRVTLESAAEATARERALSEAGERIRERIEAIRAAITEER
ncbi:MAG TPA: hypothetical protein VKA36_05415, partial [Solirubrobacterales bacterium]|nr:hypothetical protein [Solirubrobacterales bacterium]